MAQRHLLIEQAADSVDQMAAALQARQGVAHIENDRKRPAVGDQVDVLGAGQDVGRGVQRFGTDRASQMFQGQDVVFDGVVQDRFGAHGSGPLGVPDLADALAVGRRSFDQPGSEDPLHGAETVISESLCEANHARWLDAHTLRQGGDRFERDVVRMVDGELGDRPQLAGQRRKSFADQAFEIVEVFRRHDVAVVLGRHPSSFGLPLAPLARGHDVKPNLNKFFIS